MTNEEIANRLDEAGELLKTHGWWNGKYYGQSAGICYCAITAINAVCKFNPHDCDEILVEFRRDLSEPWISTWNDKQSDGQAVIAALHGAATRLRAQGTV